MWRKLMFYLVKGVLILSPVKTHHRERLPEGPCIVCPNHAALRDPFCVAMAVGNHEYLHYMTKASYYDKPVIGPFIRSIGAFRVDPEKGYLSAIREAMQYLKEGEKVCIFPEGTRNRTGEDLEGKAGAAMIAARMHVPVIPTKIENSRKFFRFVHVTFGAPMYIEVAPRGAGSDAYHEAANRIMEAIHSL